MLFNSIDFAVFLPLVFIIYWFLLNNDLKLQNAFITLSSFVFYGWWDWRFLFLMIFSAGVDFFVGNLLRNENNQRKRKLLLFLSIFVNLGILGFFKYFNFFAENFVQAFTFFGAKINPVTLKIILPVGVSFYTFQALSYTIDVYKRKLEPTDSIVNYFAFISFFPQLVAGPIERATNLLPQFYSKRSFDVVLAKDGLRQILWGLFKKIVIADNAAVQVKYIFANHATLPASTLWLGSFYFALQIYCDFSGYSDIAIGSARLFGFKIMRNFAFPYFSRDIAEFWRRWHISLSTWFRDYLYFPLGGSRGSLAMKTRNVIIIFVVSGFWHGANWTFVIWGLLNGLYFLPLLLLNQNRNNLNIIASDSFLPTFREFSGVVITFLLTLIAWVFFRAENVTQGIQYLFGMFNTSIFSYPVHAAMMKNLPFIALMFLVEWFQRRKQHGLDIVHINYRSIRWAIYYSIILLIILFGGAQQDFIYFQF